MRLGVEASVVHTRLARAHGRLRASLERELGPQRALALLGVLARRPLPPSAWSTPSLTGGLIAMGIKSKLVAALAVAILGALLWWSTRESVAPAEAAQVEARASDAAEPDGASTAQAAVSAAGDAEGERVGVEPSELPADAIPAPWAAPAFEYELVFAASDGRDLPLVHSVVLLAPSGEELVLVGSTDRRGECRVRWLGFTPTMEIDCALGNGAGARRLTVSTGSQRIAMRDPQSRPVMVLQSESESARTLEISLEVPQRSQVAGVRVLQGIPIVGQVFSAPSEFLQARHDAQGRVQFVAALESQSLGGLGQRGAALLFAEQTLVISDLRAQISRFALDSVAQSEGRAFRLSGELRDEHGAALAGCTVLAREPEGDAWRYVETDSEGRWEFTGLSEGSWELLAGGGELAPVTHLVRGRAGDELRWDAVCVCGPEVRGLLLGKNGEPLASWDIWIEDGDTSNPFVDSARSDADGRFRICGVPRHALRMLAAPAGHSGAPMVVAERVWASSDELQLRLDLSAAAPTGELHLDVRDDRGAAAPVRLVRAWRLDCERASIGELIQSSMAYASSSGSHGVDALHSVSSSFDQLLPGWYRIELLAPGRAPLALPPVEVHAGHELVLDPAILPPTSSLSFEFDGNRSLELLRRTATVELFAEPIAVMGRFPMLAAPGEYWVRSGSKAARVELAPGARAAVELSAIESPKSR